MLTKHGAKQHNSRWLLWLCSLLMPVVKLCQNYCCHNRFPMTRPQVLLLRCVQAFQQRQQALPDAAKGNGFPIHFVVGACKVVRWSSGHPFFSVFHCRDLSRVLFMDCQACWATAGSRPETGSHHSGRTFGSAQKRPGARCDLQWWQGTRVLNLQKKEICAKIKKEVKVKRAIFPAALAILTLYKIYKSVHSFRIWKSWNLATLSRVLQRANCWTRQTGQMWPRHCNLDMCCHVQWIRLDTIRCNCVVFQDFWTRNLRTMRSKLASAHTRPTARLPSQLFVGCSPVLDQPTLIQEGKVQFDTVHRHNFLINAVTASHIHETWADCYLRSCCIDGAANVGDELHGNRTDDNQRNNVINNDQHNKEQSTPLAHSSPWLGANGPTAILSQWCASLDVRPGAPRTDVLW